jgi:hypothetical protein
MRKGRSDKAGEQIPFPTKAIWVLIPTIHCIFATWDQYVDGNDRRPCAPKLIVFNPTRNLEKPMRAESQDLTESMTKLDKKEWREPRLRRLPIAATAHGGKTIGTGDDGGNKVGDATNVPS